MVLLPEVEDVVHNRIIQIMVHWRLSCLLMVRCFEEFCLAKNASIGVLVPVFDLKNFYERRKGFSVRSNAHLICTMRAVSEYIHEAYVYCNVNLRLYQYL